MVYGIADYQLIPGYTLGSFSWWIALIVIGVSLFVGTLSFFLVKYVFGYLRMSDEEIQTLKQKKNELKTKGKTKTEKQSIQNSFTSKEQTVFKGGKLLKRVFVPILAVLGVIGSIGGPILDQVWSPMWMAITGNKSVTAIDNESSRIAAQEAGVNIVEIEKEGAVLLRNEDDVLPLSVESNKKVNIFGAGAFGMFYGNGGSGAVQTTYRPNSAVKDRNVVKFEEAMAAEGFEINPYLFNLVKNYFPLTAGNTDTGRSDRASRSYSVADSDNKIECGVNTYGYAEIVRTCLPYNHEPEVSAYEATYPELDGKTLLEQAKEFSDTAIFCISRYGTEDSDMNYSELTLKDREKDVIGMLKENFDKVIILLNVSHAMEIGSLAEEGIDSVLLIGQPGITGNTAVAKIIAGEFNPSGKLADTWAYSVKSAPSYQSMGNDTTLSYSNSSQKFVEYTEGIYVGYRYYVTRGMTDSNFKYDEEVQYSFGYGKSYTTFEKWIQSYEFDAENNEYKVVVSVKNTGDVAGKDVIELYSHTPYTGSIQKSWYSLLAFKKTNVIEPGEAKAYELKFSLRDMASWDSENGYYVLEKGNYEISLRDDVWNESVSNGNDTHFNFDLNLIEYKTSYQTGESYSKNFEVAEYGPSSTPITYLSRSDWDGSWTSTDDLRNTSLDSSHNEAINLENKKWSDNTIDEDEPTTGANNGLTLEDLKNADWDDDNWEPLLDQLTVSDMENLVEHGGFQTAKIDSIGKKKAVDYDGPAAAFHSGSGHPCGIIVADSWNTDVAVLFGESIGKEGAAAGLTGWYAPGINIHRSPFGGRNFEYYSEDPLISGLMAGYTSQGTMEFGVYCYAKHMALNDQEYNRVQINTWANEQSIREIYLRPFEIYSDLGGIGYMTSFNRIGDTWAGAHTGMLTNVVRNEWGFHGVIVTDYVNSSYMNVAAGLRAQNDLWLDPNNTGKNCVNAYNAAPNDVIILMRRACKNILYACAHSNIVWDDADWAEAGIKNPNK